VLVFTYAVPAPTQVLELPVSTIKLSVTDNKLLIIADFSHIALTGSRRTANANLCNVADSLIDDRDATSTTAETGAIHQGSRASLVMLQEVDGSALEV
jgi:hypothetical protein